jgi:hypothetical protein
MKMAVFWVVAPCSLVEVYRRSPLSASYPEVAVMTNLTVVVTDLRSVITATSGYEADGGKQGPLFRE